MGMVASLYYTADMVRALPEDGNRYETVHGELLVTPSPRLAHQYVLTKLSLKIGYYLDVHPVGQLLFSPADISWDDDILVQPDIFVAALREARTFDWKQVRTLLLAVEILSPSTERYDRFIKRRVYQEYRVGTYWIVDIKSRVVEVWTPGAMFPVVEEHSVSWRPQGAAESLVISLKEILPPAGV
jgi:Uma2 family endonuclease